ncbi:PAS domain S-box protein [Bacillus shivajii]|uniref:PAS domain S-box protein n=1 Tax=Bacillus shivajii TaxID=1983719 RepID=UPI00384DD0B8
MDELYSKVNSKGRKLLLDSGKNGDVGFFSYRHDENGVFEQVSESVTTILGYHPNEVMENFERILTDSPINEAAVEYTDLSLKGIQQPKYPVELIRKDGSKCKAEIAELPVFNEKGQVVAVEGLVKEL